MVFKPGENKDGTLILNSPAPFKNRHSGSGALIHAEGISLTIEGEGVIKGDGIEPRAAVNVLRGSLTLKTENLEAYGGNSGILVQGGSLRIAEGTQRVYAEGEAGILAQNGITIDQGLSIVNPEHGSAREISIESGIPFYAVCAENSYDPAPRAEITADQRTVTWNPGYEGADPVTEQAPVGKEITIPSVSDEKIGFTHPDGEAFVGWKKDPSNRAAGDTEIYAPGDTYMIQEDVSFTAQWENTFPIWVNGIQIKSDNMDDVLEDGTVSYDSGTNTLTLENPKKMDGLHKGAWIYADGIDLTIKGNAQINTANSDNSYGIAVTKGSLTLKTDHLSVTSNNYGLYIAGEDQDNPESLSILSGTLTVNSILSDAIHTSNANLLIQDDPSGLTEVSSVIAAGSDAYSINGDFTIGNTLEIIDPENAKIDQDGSNRFVYDTDRNEKAARVEISRREDEPPATYDVIYWITGDIPSDAIVPDPQTGLEAGAQVDVADKPETQETEHDGVPGTYSFEGWTAPEGITVEDGHFTMPESDVTFTGKWTFTPAEYTVAFVDEDGSTPLLPPKTYAYGTPVDKIIKPQEPSKAADDQYIYTFDGWQPALAKVTEDVTYRATYKKTQRSDEDESYTVTFDSDGGSPVPDAQRVKKGDTAKKPADPVKEGYTFGTWTLDESAYDFSQPVTKDITLVAVWNSVQPDDEGDYEVTDETPDHYYEIFQIFTGDYIEMPNDEGEGTHPVLTNIVWGKNGKYPEGSSKGDPVSKDILQELYNVTNAEMDKTKLAEIEKYVDLRSDPVRTPHVEGTDPVTVPLPSGYYLIRDMNNSQTGRDDAYTTYITVVVKDYTITPKMVKPSVDKQVSDEEDYYYETSSKDNPTNKDPGVNDFYESADHAMNESFRFRLAATLPASSRYVDYDEYKLIFHDTMSEGVTFESIESVKMGNVDLEYTTDGISAGDAGKEWTLTVTLPKGQDGSYKNLKDGTVVEVIYQAHLNEQAVVHSENASNDKTNSNSVYLEYSNNPNVDIYPSEDHKADTGKTEPDSVWVFTYRTDCLKKTDAEDGPPLEGAGFTLYQGETAIKLINQGNGSYIVADQTATDGVITEMVTGKDGVFKVIGLDAGSYTIKETSVPRGYNQCSDTPLTIEASHAENDSTSDADLDLKNSQLNHTIVNESGAVLPSTGGLGTRLFRLFGILLILSAGIILITRRRVEI